MRLDKERFEDAFVLFDLTLKLFVFLTLLFMAIFRFTKTDHVPITAAKAMRNRVYVVCGVIMLVCFVWIGLLKLHAPATSIVIPESGAIIAFAVAWLTKGQAILPD